VDKKREQEKNKNMKKKRYRISMRTVEKRKELKLILKCMIYYKISHS
jgi:hypothetical protein